MTPKPEILLSVLIPSIPRRLPKLTRLLETLSAQADPRMEVLVLMDNQTRHLGVKRNALMDMAAGRFCCHIDDDETLSPHFFSSLLPEMAYDVDLIAYNANVTLNGSAPFKVTTILGAQNEQPRHLPDGRFSDIVRAPWMWCLWRTALARTFRFPEYHHAAEDWFWLSQILPAVESHRKLEETLFTHNYCAKDSTFDGGRHA